MCGIAGFVRKRPLESQVLMDEMLSSIRHRGPDGSGSHIENQFAVGMTRLAILDLVTGDQPIYNEDRSVAVVCNGEIYNFMKLRSDLERSGHRFTTNSDVEVIVHLYEEHGDDLVEHLEGMFAYAIFDRRRKRIVIGRDRLGIKPLFLAETSDTVVFGSEIKVILCEASVSKDLDFQALDEYLTYNYVPYPRTIYAGIRKIPPGHYLTIDERGETQLVEYWSAPRPSPIQRSLDDWHEEIKDCLQAAVKSHMVSDVPVAVFLSGGVDSSLIAAMAAQSVDAPLQSFTIAFKDAGSAFLDERVYAREVADRYNFDHTELEIEPSFEEIEEQLARAFDEPFADDSVIPTYYLCQLTGSHVKVALSGLGGDELFAGYRRHLGLKLSLSYRRIPGFLRKGLIGPLVRRLPESNESNPLVDHLKRFVRGSELDDGRRYQSSLSALPTAERLALYNADVRHKVNSEKTESVITSRMSGDSELVGQALFTDLQTYLVDDVLALTDRLSMLHSLEVRVPFLDHKLVELASQIPTNLKIRGFEQKKLLRDVASAYVPRSILTHRKQGFESPMSRWLRGPLKALVDERLSQKKIERQGLFSSAKVSELWQDHQSRKSQNSKTLFALLMFQAWHQLQR